MSLSVKEEISERVCWHNYVFKDKANLMSIWNLCCFTKERNLVFLVFIVEKKNVLCVEIFCYVPEKYKQVNNKGHYFNCQIFLLADWGFLFYFIRKTVAEKFEHFWNWHHKVDNSKFLPLLIKSLGILRAVKADCCSQFRGLWKVVVVLILKLAWLHL